MAIGLYGYSSLALDSEGRIAMPAKYKEALKEVSEGSLVITRDPQYPSLRIYPGSLWKTISKAFENLSGLDSKIRSIQWNFLGYANLIDFEVNDRMQILIPQSLRDYAQLKVKEKVSLIGMGQKFEVWNEKNWLAKEKGQQIQGEKLDIDLPSNVQEIPF